jgi:hypothetical protein
VHADAWIEVNYIEFIEDCSCVRTVVPFRTQTLMVLATSLPGIYKWNTKSIVVAAVWHSHRYGTGIIINGWWLDEQL